MKFCSNCGKTVSQKIPEGDNRLRFVCDHCHSIHYENPRIIAGIIPEYNGQILLCKRAIEPQQGLWTLPAGFLENGESTLEGAVRECFEEANAMVIAPSLYAMYDIPHINQVYIFFRAQLANSDFGPSTESTEVALFDEDEIPWKDLAFPVVRKVLDKYLNNRKQDQFAVITGTIQQGWKGRRQ
jgi:ADP-ribose pyrophosphatase YjhB (NUDIX family)